MAAAAIATPPPEFENNIKKWVKYDDKIRELNEEIRLLRRERSRLESDICSFVEDNRLKSAVISISDGRLQFKTKTSYGSLSLTHIEKCLNHFISDQMVLNDIMMYIKTKRLIKKSDIIVRTIDGNNEGSLVRNLRNQARRKVESTYEDDDEDDEDGEDGEDGEDEV